MNTIIITEKDLVDFSEYECAHYFEHFIFNEFRLIFKRDEFKIIYKFRINGTSNHVKYRTIHKGVYNDCEFTFKDGENDLEWIEQPHGEFVDKAMKSGAAEGEKEILEYFQTEIVFLSYLKQYIMNKSYERKIVLKESKSENRGEVGSNGAKTRKNVDKKPITQFLLNDIIEYTACSGRKHGIKCECWDVRGHFRHYKNGKVSWIPPYEKGKQRKTGVNRGGKTYKLS